VLKLCDRQWVEINERKKRIAMKMSTGDSALSPDYDEAEDNEQIFWILANRAEAYYGLGDMDEYKKAYAKAQATWHTDWMMKAHDDQHAKLSVLLNKYGHLLNPAWKEG
jgi:hypothetical protein